ncbi:hypothetical protein WDU94_006027 [Cyamophila willieti]
MVDALEAVRMGQMSINQAAIHFNLPYSSLYGRFKRVKYEADHPEGGGDGSVIMDGHHPSPAPSNQSQSSVQSHHTTSQYWPFTPSRSNRSRIFVKLNSELVSFADL